MKSAIVLAGLLAAGFLRAQVSQTTTIERHIEITAATPSGAPQTGALRWLGTGAALESKVVKGAPYSARGVIESVRLLADGTRIVQKSTFKVFRDREGRTRREYTAAGAGEGAAAGEAVTTITIYDPVAGALYLLSPADKTARRIRLSIDEQISSSGAAGEKRQQEVWAREVVVPAPAVSAWFERRVPGPGGPESAIFGGAFGGERLIPAGGDAKEEALGERMIEGVLARGTRLTHTIPTGRIGNDRPITIVQERWHSPELDVTILSETKDPLSGDVTYRLSGVERGDPPPSLFEIAADYKIEESGVIQRKVRIIEQSGPQKR